MFSEHMYNESIQYKLILILEFDIQTFFIAMKHKFKTTLILTDIQTN